MKLSIFNFLIIFLCFTGMPLGLFAQNKPNSSTIPSATARPVPAAYPTGTGWNYIRVWEPARPLTNPATVSTYTDAKDVQQSTQYFDGLGRILQTVNRGISPKTVQDNAGKKDLVNPVVYDDFGREAFEYLPYVLATNDGEFRQNPFPEQAIFLVSQYADESIFYSETNFEASPLNRVLKTMAPGNSWGGNGRGVIQSYKVNIAADEVKQWTIGSGGYPEAAIANYASGQLYKNITKDESNQEVVEFQDKSGRLILKKIQVTNFPGLGHAGWLCTYYVYDDVGNLRYVLPPKAVEVLAGNNWDASNISFRQELCYQYLYDGHRRMIFKQLPGAEPVEMVYDSRDRLVFSQDGNLRAQHKWLATFYDELNRPKMTALYTTSENAATLQADLLGASTTQPITYNIPVPSSLTVNVHDGRNIYKAGQEIIFTEGFDTNTDETETELNAAASQSTEIVYVSNYLPTLNQANLEPLTYTYYNDYTFSGKRNPEALSMASIGTPFIDELPISYESNGLKTGTKVKVLDGSNLWLTTTIYYDNKGRVRQTLTDNVANGVDVTTNLYDFNGQLLSTNVVQRNPRSQQTPHTTVLTMMEYDHAGRILVVRKKINDQTPVDIATNEYDALGQLKEIVFKRTDGTSLESLVYDYNIRGWMRGINKDYADGIGGHYFGQELNYDYGFDIPQYNGNVAGIKWRGFNDGERRTYGYSYDGVNRLLKAEFNQYTGGTWSKSANVNFDVVMGDGFDPAAAYDANGNIKRMQQWGLVSPGVNSQIDDLRYTYSNNEKSNKLQAVTDEGINSNLTLGDFTEVVKGQVVDYTYDVNGNIISDNNKQINQITYNHLNLPQQIVLPGKGIISYVYDATGLKHRKVVSDQTVSPAKVTTTDYIGGMIYEDDRLELINHEEGRVRIEYPSGEPVQYTFDYFIKDHLENVRMVLTEQTLQQLYMASMEMEHSATENALFSNIDASRSHVPVGYPDDKTTTKNKYVAQLNGGDPNRRIGPSLILKVMAGDTVSIRAKAFYKSIGNKQSNTLVPAQDMAKALMNSFGSMGSRATEKDIMSGADQRSPFNEQFVNNQYRRMKEKESSAGSQAMRPKAYLNFVLFDEQLNLVDDNSGVRQVHAQPDQLQILSKDKMVIKKGGFLYVYTSNETSQNVFFDNLTVTTNPGALLEETHYYPFGLIMEGISYKAIGKPGSIYKFNGYELNDIFNLNLYESHYRIQDPQIGRFWQPDPETEALSDFSPYESMGNNPITNVDPMGDFKTRLQAWLHSLMNGGKVHRNEYGEWYVLKTKVIKGQDGVTEVKPEVSYGKGRHKYSAAGEDILDEVDEQQFTDQLTRAKIWDPNLPQDEAGKNALNLGLLVISTSKLTPQSPKAPAAPAANIVVKERGTTLTRFLESIGKNTKEAAEFFGWGNKTNLTKSVSDFTKKGLLKNGWTKKNLVKLARAYNDQIVKAQKLGMQNPAAVVRRDQAMELARKFF